MGFELVPMSLRDLDAIVEIEKLTFVTPWSRDSYVEELESELTFYIVSRWEDRVTGFAGMWLIVDECHITNIAVHPEFQHQGLGTVLLNELVNLSKVQNAKGITLEVRPSNTAAINLYRKCGFIPTGVRPGYYTDTGEDAVIMWKYLVPKRD